jgi:hypothetical protein
MSKLRAVLSGAVRKHCGNWKSVIFSYLLLAFPNESA